MKIKKRRAVEAPPKVRAFINSVLSVPLENIDKALETFSWDYDKGDFHHWVDLFNHFESFFEKYVKPRKDLQLDLDSLELDPPFPRESVLQIIRVSRIILENCTNKYMYTSYDHLSILLASSDTDVVLSSLSTLAAFVKKPMAKCLFRDGTLNARLFALSQGWGGKEDGVGLLACSTSDGPDPVACQLGSTLHFEYYVDEKTDQESCTAGPRASGLQVIHISDLCACSESDLQLLKNLTAQYYVPSRFRFSLLTRIRFARAFSQLESRRKHVRIRLLALTVLAQLGSDGNDLAAFFTNEPEFVNELVTLIRFEDTVPEVIRILAILALAALYQDRSRQSSVLNAISSGANRGMLPSLMQKAVNSITRAIPVCSVPFVEALLSLIRVVVSTSSGCNALKEIGLMPTLLPLLKDYDQQHMHLVTAAVNVLESFMDYSNPVGPSFRDLGGMENTIERLKYEVCPPEVKADAAQSSQHETLVPYNRRLLIKALLRAISLGTYTPGNAARLDGCEESSLPSCLCAIFRRAKDFGGGVFSLAATVMSDLIHKDPTSYSTLDAAGLPNAFLDALMAGVPPSSDAVACIPQSLDALCLNNLGLQAITERGALKCFVKIFTSKTYLRALSGDTSGSLSTALDELVRHAASLKGPVVDILVEILHTIGRMGIPNDVEETSSSSVPVPMETDSVQNSNVQADVDEIPKGTSEQCSENAAEHSSTNSETFIYECISNTTRLLEHILHNADICRMFVEKKGIEAVLELFEVPLLSFPSGQTISVAFKNFSSQHSSALTKDVCSAFREYLMLATKSMEPLTGKKLADIEGCNKTRILRRLSSLEGVISFSTQLLKSTATMMPEIGSGDAEILKDLGNIYKEVIWQLSLVNDTVLKDVDEGPSAGSQSSNISNTESDNNVVPTTRYANSGAVRNPPTSHWSIEPENVSLMQFGVHRHRRGHLSGIDAINRFRFDRFFRHSDATDVEISGSTCTDGTQQGNDSKKKSLDLEFEILNKLAVSMRVFFVTIVKVLVVPSRRRDDPGSLSATGKSVVASLAKLFLESLNVDESRTGFDFDSLLSAKCRYLGKVVEDMVPVIYDNRRRMCNAAVVNTFYAQGAIKSLLKTFEATCQLLWTGSFMSQREMDTTDASKPVSEKVEHSTMLLDTLKSYCRLLEYLVNSSLLLSASPASQLVQQVANASVPVPRDPESFVRTLQSQVLYAVLPIWNHPVFPSCSPNLITSIVTILNHIYSGTSVSKEGRGGTSGSTGHRHRGFPPDETVVSTMVDMGFPRARVEEALRNVQSNSVEMAMEWIFSHPEEPAQEDDDLAQALALSLGSSEAAKDTGNEQEKEAENEDKLVSNPPVEEILSTCMNLLQSADSVAFPVTDLIVTLCTHSKGQYRVRVVSYLVRQLKHCKVDGDNKDASLLSAISHILALLISEDSSSREAAAVNGLTGIALNLLSNFVPADTGGKVLVPKWVTALLLILNHMLQCRLQLASDSQKANVAGGTSNVAVSEDPSANQINDATTNENNKTEESVPFVKTLGNPSGYMTYDEQCSTMSIVCDYLQLNLPSITVQAILQLCARLTKSYPIAALFLENGGLTSLLKLPRSSLFPGFDSVAAVIIRHLLEDPHTLQVAMEVEIRQFFSLHSPRGNRSPSFSLQTFLTELAPVISRDPAIFMQAAAAICQLQTVGGRHSIILLEREDKDKVKEKEKAREKDKKVPGQHEAAPALDLSKNHDGGSKQFEHPGKPIKGHKKIPHSFSQVIDQLLEIIMQYPNAQFEEDTGVTAMDVDGMASKAKGKAKVDDFTNFESESASASYAGLAKVSFILKLMCDILQMYTHAISVVLKRDSEISQNRGSCQAAELAGHGLLHHVLRRLLQCAGDKKSESNIDEWNEKLSEKASWFLVVVCGRSSEGRRRLISEIVKALDEPSNISHSSMHAYLPNKNAIALVNLINSILSYNASSRNLQAPGCSPDMAKTMIDAGMIQALTNTLAMIDLDHPDAPKLVNQLLKALESLTRAAGLGEEIHKSEENEKKKPFAEEVRVAGASSQFTITEGQENQNETENNTAHQGDGLDERRLSIQENVSDPPRDVPSGLNENAEQDMQIETDEHDRVQNAEHGDHITSATAEEASDLHSLSPGEVQFQRLERRLSRRSADDIADEDDDEDMDDEGDEEDEDDEEEEEDEMEEGDENGAHMSLADTDVEDHEDNALGDDYGEDIVEDDEDGFHGDRVIEVRWREVDGLNHVQVLGHTGGDGNLVDLTTDPFHVNMDEIFGIRHPAAVERRRPSVRRALNEQLSANRGDAFQHPLLRRPVQPSGMVSNGSGWTTSANMSNDLIASSGGFDATHYFMRGSLRHGRWTDDGQPQASSHSSAIAHAIEEEFVSQLRGLTQADENVGNQGDAVNADVAIEPQATASVMETATQSGLRVGDENERVPEQPMSEAENPVNEATEHQAQSSNVERTSTSACETNRDGADIRMSDDLHETETRDMQSEGQDNRSNFATMSESLHSSEVEAISVDGQEDRERPVDSQAMAASVMATSIASDSLNSVNATNDQGSMEPGQHAAVGQGNPVDESSVQLQAQDETVNATDNVQGQSAANDEANANTIDPTFLEALPDDLRAEVLASQQVRSAGASNYAPPTADDIDPEFLAALPPEIQAEVLAQQQAQRGAQSEQAEGQPVDMDSASIIATFPAELREEVLLTSSEAVLAALSPALLAEAQMLRERAMNQYHSRSFFGSNRLGGRRNNVTARQTGMERRVGGGLAIGRRQGPSVNTHMKIKDVEGKPLVDKGALKAMLQLLRLAQPLGKGLLQRLLFNLCAHSGTRITLVQLLLEMLRPEAAARSDRKDTKRQRLYGCQWNMVYACSQHSDGVPALVTRRVLEILTYLAKNHSGVADLLFYKEGFSTLTQSGSPLVEESGKGKMVEDSSDSQQNEIPLILLLKLLNQPLFSRSNSHLDQVMGLLEVIMSNVGLRRESEGETSLSKDASSQKESEEATNEGQRETMSNMDAVATGGDPSQKTINATEPSRSLEASTSGSKEMSVCDVLLKLPERELKNLCKLLAKEGLSDSIYSKVTEVLKKMATYAPAHRKLFVSELAESACSLSGPAVEELLTLGEMASVGVNSGTMAGAAILRVLQALGTLTSEEDDKDHESIELMSDLNVSLDVLWQGLSSCIGKIETQLGSAQDISASRGSLSSAGASVLPPCTQRALPFIEAFFVLCEKIHGGIGGTQNDSDEATSSDIVPNKRVEGHMTFVKFAEKHRRLLNAFVRQQHGLLDKSFNLLLKMPRLIDFDNKRSFFRSHIRQQNEHNIYNPLRICVRRTYILEDSYNQLRMRSVDDLKGRLTVQFQGEEGIDAGGLTREWYQLLSRVIFDKGALLFTTVGNQSTFQPNPNSVFQTEHLSYFKFVGRVVAKALFDGQLLDVYFTRSFYKHILGAKVTYHDIEAIDPDYYKNLKWMLENDISDILDLTFSMDADEEKHILYEKTEVMDYELIPDGRNIRVTEENKHKYVDLVAEHRLTTAIRPQINAFLEGFHELIPKHLISIFNDKELELLISGLPEIDFDDLKSSTEYTGYNAVSSVIQWFWDIVQGFSKEDMARLLQFVTGTSKVPLEGFKALQGISGPQRFQIHKAYGAPERLPTAHTCFNQLDLPEYSSKEQLEERLLLAIHEGNEGFGFG
eukprot:TRINITY_DN1943_c0_g1_i1.p1 TRINITY_DN1943_c0_g1~~TRINITY_DN1943_c0_g1_i1.p1  ORF type:complete len:3671 (+),score=717.88 TRINITY_DN1943_c0_g1_i1:355-11367(+)